MRRLLTTAFAVLCACAWPFPGDTQWTRTEVGQRQVCVDAESGEAITPTYLSKQFVTVSCNVLNDIERWLGGTLVQAQFLLMSAPTDPQPSIPAGWSQGEYFGSADPHTSGSTAFVSAGSVFSATNIDGRFFYTDDSGAVWVYTPAAADDFTVTVRIDSLDLANGVKAFLQVRDENTANSAHASVEMVPTGFIGVQRTTTAGETSIPFGPSGTAALGACLRVSNDGSQDSLLLEYAPDDGAANDCSDASYTTLGQVIESWASTGDSKYVVMSCASINPNRPTPCNVSFSAVTISTAAVTHPGGGATVGWNPTSYSFDEDVGTGQVCATLSGSNADGCTINASTQNGAAIGGTDFTAFTNSVLTWTSGQTGERCQNLSITDRAGVQSPQDRDLTVVLTKNTCTAPTLVNATATVTILETDNSEPGVGVIFIADNEGRATVSGATDAIKDANLLAAQWGEPGVDPGNGQMCVPVHPTTAAHNDPDCGHPNVYAFLSDDSGNGGPSSARAGTYFMKLRRNPNNQIGSQWAIGSGTENRVLVEDQIRAYCTQRQACWVGFSIWIPSSINANNFHDNSWSFVAGIHQPWPQPTALIFEFNDFAGSNDFAIRTRSYPGDCCAPEIGPNFWEAGSGSEPGTSHTFASTGTTSRLWPRDQWVDIVYKIVFDERTSGSGELEVWINGALEVDYSGPVGYKNPANEYGGNKWLGRYTHGNDTVTTVYYYDEVRVGNSTSSFADVDPASYD